MYNKEKNKEQIAKSLWFHMISGTELPENVPYNPEEFYGKEFKGWVDWMEMEDKF